MKYVDGSKYDGEWKDDKRNGKGINSYPDESIYDGEWKDDLRHGFGIHTTPIGLVTEGVWSEDIPIDVSITKRPLTLDEIRQKKLEAIKSRNFRTLKHSETY